MGTSDVHYRLLKGDERPSFDKTTYDALFIESIEELVTHHNPVKSYSDIEAVLKNVNTRINEYTQRNKPVYWNRILSDEFIDFCYENDLSELFERLDNSEGMIWLDSDHQPVNETEEVTTKLTAESVVEIGGCDGSGCVWNSARKAQAVVSRILPGAIHPNDIENDPPFFKVAKMIINPWLSEGDIYLPRNSSEAPTTLEHFFEFPAVHNTKSGWHNQKEIISFVNEELKNRLVG